MKEVNYKHALITGGAGFVGSNLALWFKAHYPHLHITAADNLKRRGSELNLPRLLDQGIKFVHCDIRNPEDLNFLDDDVDLIIECSAEPSVVAGYSDGPNYLINTNLLGTVNCLELARRNQSDFVFLSSSRVYPVEPLNQISTIETDTRLIIAPKQSIVGISEQGVSEKFPLEGVRSLYGATKLCSELLIQEYGAMYNLRYIINRCGVLTGPWQMGKVDQGVFALWMAKHYFGGELSYIGWGGEGKQVRDLLHIDDLAALLNRQIEQFELLTGKTFNVGGGEVNSLSLAETTQMCEEITGRTIPIAQIPKNRPDDLKLYITDNSYVTQLTGWTPKYNPLETLVSIFEWLNSSAASVGYLWR